MTQNEFKRAIWNGLGRVIVYLQDHDVAPYREIILYECLHNTAYDPQAEGLRSRYLFEIINLTNEPLFYRDAILAALVEAVEDDSWQLEHLFYLAGEFAKAGDDVARQAMFAKVDVEVANDFWVGLVLIETFGVEGFLFLIDLLGQAVLETGEFHNDDYYLRTLEEREPSISAREIKVECDAARAVNPRIEAYLAGVEGYRAAHDRKKIHGPLDWMKDLSFDDVRELVNKHVVKYGANQPYRSLGVWGKYASEEQLLEAAEEFLKEENERKLSSYLWIFHKVQFPLDINKIIGIAQHKVYWFAVGALIALQQIRHPTVRQLALSLIESERHIGWAVGLLGKNLEDGDWELIEDLTAHDLDADTYELMGIRIRDLLEDRPELPRISALLNLYEYGQCSMCRHSVVEMLHESGQLTEEIREECRYDASMDLRKWVDETFGQK